MGFGSILGGVGGFAFGGPIGAVAGSYIGDYLDDSLSGGGGGVSPSGAFPNLDDLGGEFSEFLLKRLRENPAESDTFRLGTEAIRDAVGGVAGAQRQRLGDAAVSGGFLDSGSVTRGNLDINRAELEAFAGSERDLLLSLIDRQTEGILPYLSAGANESLGLATVNANNDNADRSFYLDLFNSFRGYGGG